MAHTPYLVEKHHETTGTPGPATTPNSCKELQTVIVGQKGKFKFELEVAYYEKENIIVFMHGLPGPEIEPTNPHPGDDPQQIVLHALNEWGKNRRFE